MPKYDYDMAVIGAGAAGLTVAAGAAQAGAVHPYPTLAEINKRVAGRHLSEKVFSDRVKKTLTAR